MPSTSPSWTSLDLVRPMEDDLLKVRKLPRSDDMYNIYLEPE